MQSLYVKKMEYDSIIFDLDGTLWNTLTACTNGWNNGLKSLGISKRITVDELKKVVGNPWNTCAEMLFPELIKKHSHLFKILDSFEQKAIKSKGGIFYDGMIDSIRTLSKIYKLFLVSNCQEWYLYEFFKQSQIEKYLNDYNCFGLSEHPKSKMIKDIVEKNTLKKPIYIGDTSGDKIAAESAGTDFIHVNWGYNKIDNKRLSFNNFAELMDYFLETTNLAKV